LLPVPGGGMSGAEQFAMVRLASGQLGPCPSGVVRARAKEAMPAFALGVFGRSRGHGRCRRYDCRLCPLAATIDQSLPLRGECICEVSGLTAGDVSYLARMRLFLALCSNSQRPSSSISGGT
jgi:hypothetical protein